MVKDEARKLNIGDMIETNSGESGLILDRELVYPDQASSPVRMYTVMWNDECPAYAIPISQNRNKISKVNAFAIKKLT